MSYYENSNNKQPESGPWFLPLFIVSVIIAGVSYVWLRTPFAGMSEEQHFQALLVLAFFVTLTFYAGIINRRGLATFVFSFIAIVASILIGYKVDLSIIQERIALKGVKNEYNKYIEAVEDDDSYGTIDIDIDTTPIASGDAGKVEKVIKELLAGGVKMHNNYLDELDELGCNRLLDEVRLQDDETLSESRKIVRNIKKCVGKYRAKHFKLFLSTRNKLKALQIKPSRKKEVLTSYDRNWRKNKKQIVEQWNLESRAVKEIDKLFNHLSFTRGKWEYHGDTFYYKVKKKDDYDVNKHNSYLKTYRDIINKQKNMRKKNLRSLMDFVKNS